MKDELKVIETDGTIKYIEQSKKHAFKQLQTIIGGYIIPIALPQGQIMVVDEDGIPKGLKINKVASAILMELGAMMDPILGTVVICSSKHIN